MINIDAGTYMLTASLILHVHVMAAIVRLAASYGVGAATLQCHLECA